jgi:hypothetical protein
MHEVSPLLIINYDLIEFMLPFRQSTWGSDAILRGMPPGSFFRPAIRYLDHYYPGSIITPSSISISYIYLAYDIAYGASIAISGAHTHTLHAASRTLFSPLRPLFFFLLKFTESLFLLRLLCMGDGHVSLWIRPSTVENLACCRGWCSV